MLLSKFKPVGRQPAIAASTNPSTRRAAAMLECSPFSRSVGIVYMWCSSPESCKAAATFKTASGLDTQLRKLFQNREIRSEKCS
jgi:hypothetical protein